MTDAYKIGVTVALNNLVSAELGRIGQEFLHVGRQADSFKVALGNIGKVGLMVGVAGAVIGITAALKAGVDEARKFQVETAKFAMFGMSDAVNKDARRFAEGMSVIGTSATEAMRLVVEAQGVFRESGLADDKALYGAKLAAPMLAKIDYVGKTLNADNAEKMHRSAQAMLRFIDMQGGLNDPVRFNAIANAGFKAINSSGGNIDWEQYRQFRARAGSAGANLSDEALFGKLEPIIQELTGATAGFSLRTAYNRLSGIVKLPNQAAHEAVKFGLWDNSKVQWNSQGGIKQYLGNPLRDADLFAKDPVAYYEKYIMPSYDKAGLTPESRTRENALLFGSTGGNLFTAIDRQMETIHRSADSWRKAKNIDQSVEIAKSTIDGQLVDTTAQWHKLMKELGERILPPVVTGLEHLNKALGWMVDLAKMANTDADARAKGAADPSSPDNRFRAKWKDWWRLPGPEDSYAIRERIYGNITGSKNPIPANNNMTPVQVTSNVILDKTSVGKSVTNFMVGGMSGPARQTAAPDYGMSYRPVN